MNMRHDHVLDPLGFDADQPQRLARTAQELATAPPGFDGVESQIDDDGEAAADDRPDEIVERPRPVMRVLEQEIALPQRSEVHTSDLQSLMRTSVADFCLKKK